MTTYGYEGKLYVLPFDHRASFSEKMLGFTSEITRAQKQTITDYKTIIYEAIDRAIELGVPLSSSAVLVDEIFGFEILKDAKSRGIVTMQTVEKSGQEEFECEFGDDFGAHLLAVKPTFAKVLVRYNASGDKELNERQRERLKKVSDFVHTHGIKLLIEPLVPPNEGNLSQVHGDHAQYDKEIRPSLTVQMIEEFQAAGIEADIWKIEGMEDREHYDAIVHTARIGDARKDVGIIILGRAETKERVSHWINAGKRIDGVIGFAVGRTVFWDPLVLYRDGKISKEEAIGMIAKEYYSYYQLFVK